MFFNTKLETIVRKPGLEQSVFGGEKENIARDVNGAMKSWTQSEAHTCVGQMSLSTS